MTDANVPTGLPGPLADRRHDVPRRASTLLRRATEDGHRDHRPGPGRCRPGRPRAYCLMLGDDALIASHRLSEWVSNAPELEEEVALANIALDLLGQARVLLARAGHIEGQDATRTRWPTCAPTASSATSRSPSCPTISTSPARSPGC